MMQEVVEVREAGRLRRLGRNERLRLAAIGLVEPASSEETDAYATRARREDDAARREGGAVRGKNTSGASACARAA